MYTRFYLCLDLRFFFTLGLLQKTRLETLSIVENYLVCLYLAVMCTALLLITYKTTIDFFSFTVTDRAIQCFFFLFPNNIR